MVSCLDLVLGLMGTLGLGFFSDVTLSCACLHVMSLIALGMHVLLWVAMLQVFDGINLIAIEVWRGAGDTRWPMLVGLLLNGGIFVSGTALVIFVWPGGVVAAWAAAVGMVVVLALMVLLRVLRDAW